MTFSEKALLLGATQTKKLRPILDEMRVNGVDVIDLGHGEPEMALDPSTVELITEQLKLGNYQYSSSQGNIDLLTKLAGLYSVGAENVLIGAGVKYLSLMTLDLLCNKGDSVVVLMPNWLSYEMQIAFGEYNFCPFYLTEEFAIDFNRLEEFIKSLDNAKVLLISTPNNPTGKVVSKEELQFLYALCKKYDITLVSDEVFSDLTFGTTKFTSLVEVVSDPKTEANYVVINSASKNYGLSGFRIGYVISNNQFITKGKYYNTISINNVPDFLQLAYLNELNLEAKHSEDIAKVKEQYDLIVRLLAKSKNFELVIRGGTSTVFPKIRPILKITTSEFAKRLLIDKKVLVIPGDIYGYESFIRISYVVSEKDLATGIALIDAYVDAVKEKSK